MPRYDFYGQFAVAAQVSVNAATPEEAVAKIRQREMFDGYELLERPTYFLWDGEPPQDEEGNEVAEELCSPVHKTSH